MSKRNEFIVFITSITCILLSVLQFIMIKDTVSSAGGEYARDAELVALVVAVPTFLIGLSLGAIAAKQRNTDKD